MIAIGVPVGLVLAATAFAVFGDHEPGRHNDVGAIDISGREVAMILGITFVVGPVLAHSLTSRWRTVYEVPGD